MGSLNTKLNELEDVKFLHLILKELLHQVDQNIEVFTCDRELGTDDFVESDNPTGPSFKAKSVTLEITWRPSGDVNHPYKHVDKVEIKWQPQCGTMRLEFRYQSKGTNRSDSYNVKYPVGYDRHFHNEYMQVKKDFLIIYKKIYLWHSVEIPRRDREKLINAVCEAFPSILDTLLVGDRSEKT